MLAAVAFCAVLGAAAGASGQTREASGGTPVQQGSSDATPAPSNYDKMWARFTQWYTSDNNAVVQQVVFSGRYQHEFAAIDADEGHLDEWNVRRMRLGSRVTLFRTFTLHAEIDLNPQEHDPFYVRLTDAYLQWNKSRHLILTVGKQGIPFTVDGATSSKELLAIDRSNLSNNLWFPQEYLPGVSASGRVAAWVYRGGVYSAGAMNREFGDFNGAYVTLALVGYDFGKRLGVKEAVLTGNYVYQRPDADNTFTRQLEHVGSVHFRFEEDRWGLRADVSQGNGYFGQADMRALMVMPFLNVTRRLQAVGRYTLIDSDDPNAIRFGTYESRLVSGRGDEYHELYLGANYYVYGHKLKLQTGLQWADMNDRVNDGGVYSGLSLTTGIRVGW
ncbi:MAG TPA: porin [Vicinamibacterales bacterium]|jgi:phosphate-selective porin OprO/OprP|nr:porin [Vicinamibacterales bacterium]